ncbi:hypothetical protein EDB83DRAFT_2529931 [Lactarius deliciosus]|nr:hypothetical protein EDB83DRAFT_2529931 [Lactarius deliciosus]
MRLLGWWNYWLLGFLAYSSHPPILCHSWRCRSLHPDYIHQRTELLDLARKLRLLLMFDIVRRVSGALGIPLIPLSCRDSKIPFESSRKSTCSALENVTVIVPWLRVLTM